jgi:ADP-ribosylglycohydrolase
MAEASFSTALDELVRIGGDTDTIASIAGQVAGAKLGASGLPAGLLSIVPERELIEDIGRRFSVVPGGRPPMKLTAARWQAERAAAA